MAHVIIRKYSKFYDPTTHVQFDPILDRSTGSFVGHAQTDADYSGRAFFEVLDDHTYYGLVTGGRDAAAPAPDAKDGSTGDPIADAAAKSRAASEANGSVNTNNG